MDETVPAKPNVFLVTKAWKWITHELLQSLWDNANFEEQPYGFLRYDSHDNGRLLIRAGPN